jgi:hypothetical protein
VIGTPSWSPDGSEVAFQRDDGIYVAGGPGRGAQLASIANPGPPEWSHDGLRVAYSVASAVFVAPVDGSAAARAVANALPEAATPSWSADDSLLAVPFARGVGLVRTDGSGPMGGVTLPGAAGPGASYSPASNRMLAASDAVSRCPGHVGIAEFGRDEPKALTGSCEIAGTSHADVIEGTPLWGDVILAGAGNDRIHAADGHTDRIDCGPGRDTVWADRTDELTGCERVFH